MRSFAADFLLYHYFEKNARAGRTGSTACRRIDLFCPLWYNTDKRQYRTKPACRLCVASADEFSVISHRNSLQYASIPASFLCNLTKNLLAHLPHILCAVLPIGTLKACSHPAEELCAFFCENAKKYLRCFVKYAIILCHIK